MWEAGAEMGPGDRVGEAYVDIHVNAAPGEAELAAFKAKVNRDFAELDRKKAEASVQLKATEFDAKINKVKQELDNLEHRKARTSVALDKAKFDAEIAEAKAEIKALSREKATINVDLRQLRAANKETRLLADAHKLEERAALDGAKAERRVASERARSTEQTLRNRAALARLSEEYERLAGKQQVLKKAARGIFSRGGPLESEAEARNIDRIAARMDLLKYKIESLGGSVEKLDPALNKDRSTIERWGSSLSKVRLQMGPISGTLAQMALGVGVLAPLITELGGGLISLVGTVGAGLAGAATVGAGALAGLGTSALGVGLIIKPMIGEFKEAAKASEALALAEKKYGASSTQAKTAREQMNHMLRGTSPEVRAMVKDYGKLGEQWHKLTAAARPAVFQAFGQSLKTVKELLPTFANESTKTTQIAMKAWEAWMKALRSNEGKKLLKDVMSGFRDSIPAAAHGLGSLVAIFGRLAAAGAHFLPGLSHGFADWALHLERSIGSGQKLTGEVGHLVSQMRDLGHLAQDTGSLLVHFFGASTTAGQGMVKSLDGAIRRWDKWTSSVHGQASLKKFFGESKTATEDFAKSLVHVAHFLFEFSRATAPIANGILAIVTAIGDLVSAGDEIIGVRQVIQGLGLALAGAFVAARILAFKDAIGETLVRLGLLEGASAGAAAATEAEAAAAGTAAAALQTEAIAATEVDAALLSAAGAGAELGTGAAAAATGAEAAAAGTGALAGVLTTVGLVALPAAVAGLGAYEIATGSMTGASNALARASERAGAAVQKAFSGTRGENRSFAANRRDAAAATRDLAKAEQELQAARKKHGAGSVQAEKAELNVAKASERVEHAIERRNKLEAERGSKFNAIKHAAQEAVVLAKAAVAVDKNAASLHQLAKAEADRRLTSLNLERAAKNLTPLNFRLAASYSELQKNIGAAGAKKIGGFVNPADVARVTDLSNRLSKLGLGRQVKNIDINSHGADQTIAKLQQLQHQAARVSNQTARLSVTTNDRGAQSKLQRLAQLSQRLTGTRSTIHILANTNNAEQAAARLRHHLLTVAHEKYEAHMTASDKASRTGELMHHHLSAYSSAPYHAELRAIDRATDPARHAESAAHTFEKNYKASLQLQGASAAVAQAQAATQAAHAFAGTTTHVFLSEYKTRGRPGHYAGGPSAYLPFASGGLSDRQLQTAAERAVIRQGGRSQKVSRPTMLTGEQGPQHPEYVIATNPAFRSDNTRYLDQAAADLGYEVVPAYKKGKGKKGKGGKGGGQKSTPPTPPAHQRLKHKYLKYDRFSHEAQGRYNLTEEDIQLQEHRYNASVDRQTRDIKAGRQSNYDYGELRGFLNKEKSDYHELRHLTNVQRGDLSKVIAATKKDLHGYLGPHSLRAARKEVAELGREEGHLKGAAKRNKAEQKRNAERHLRTLEKEREKAQEILKEANERLGEITGRKGELMEGEREVALEEVETNEENFQRELEEGISEGGGGGAPSLAEQTSSYNEARQQLYQSFGSNLAGQGVMATQPGGIMSSRTTGQPNYFPHGKVSGTQAPTGQAPVATIGVGHTIINNFAFPPPDPHTWTHQQQFELGALA